VCPVSPKERKGRRRTGRERSGFRVPDPEIEEKGNGGRTSIEFDTSRKRRKEENKDGGRSTKSKEYKDTTS